MDPQAQSSFIPKKPLTGTPRSGRNAFGLIYLIAVFIFVISLLAAGGAFAYVSYLQSSLVAKQRSLELAKGAYEPASIEDLIRLDRRINNAKSLLSRHIAPTAIFGLLEEDTLQKVQFTNFNYITDDQNGATIELDGIADSFATVALQSDEFGASKALNEVVFSNIEVQANGRITFSVRASVNPDIMLYSRIIEQETGLPSSLTPNPPPATTTAPVSSTTPPTTP
jgi:hypothetical protein